MADLVKTMVVGTLNPIYSIETKDLEWNYEEKDVRDAILVMNMLSGYFAERFDWLHNLDCISPENQEAALHLLVEYRTRARQLPLWIYIAIRKANERGWEVPEEWVEILKAACTLHNPARRPYDETEAGFFRMADAFLKKGE